MTVIFKSAKAEIKCESISLREGDGGIQMVLRNERETVIAMYDFGEVRSIKDSHGVEHKIKLIL